jgi:hypothetical protein
MMITFIRLLLSPLSQRRTMKSSLTTWATRMEYIHKLYLHKTREWLGSACFPVKNKDIWNVKKKNWIPICTCQCPCLMCKCKFYGKPHFCGQYKKQIWSSKNWFWLRRFCFSTHSIAFELTSLYTSSRLKYQQNKCRKLRTGPF